MHFHLNDRRFLLIVLICLITLTGCQEDGGSYSFKDLKTLPKRNFTPPDTTDIHTCFKDIAYDTWLFFEQAVDKKNGLVTDKINFITNQAAGFTSITNMGLQMIAVLSSLDFGFIDSLTAQNEVESIIKQLQKLPTYKGFLYNWYDLRSMKQAREYISSVDAAWLYSSLAVVSVAFPDLADECRLLTDKADFSWLYDDSLHHFYLGYDTKKESFSPYHYGLLCSESRMCLYYGITAGQIEPDSWYYQKKTLPADFKQEQIPRGHWVEKGGVRYFQGYYTYNGQKIIPSWGGALFEFFMPTMFVNEQLHAEQGIGKNGCLVANIHKDYALNQMEYPVWGMSPSSLVNGGYGEFGVPDIGARKDGYSPGIVSPHASILTVLCHPEVVFENIKLMLQKYPSYGPYGFYDAIDPVSGEVGEVYLALDQAMILISLNNYLNDNAIARRFEMLPGFEFLLELLNDDWEL